MSSAEKPELSSVLFLKRGGNQNKAIGASPTARNAVFLFSVFLVHSTSFSQSTSEIN